MTTNTTSTRGVSFAGLLTLLFITLKLTGIINWSWIWVVSPLWISALIVIAVMFTVGLVLAVAGLVMIYLNSKD